MGTVPTEKIFCGLDIGSQSIKAGLARVKSGASLELLGVYEMKTGGFKDASVTDLAEFSECIHQTIQGLLKKTGHKVKEVSVGVNGELVDTRMSHALIPLVDRGTKIISQGDIKKVSYQARLLGIKMDEEIVHEFAQSYQVDEVNSILNPLGLYGRKIGVHSLLIVANINRLRNVMKAVSEAGFDVGSLFFTSYISSDVTLDEKDKKDGCVLIDIGSKVTAVLVFKDGLLRFLDKINIGGEHFTRSIAQQLNFPLELAEEIKKSYAAVGSSPIEKEEILVKKENQYLPVKREVIFQAIKAETDHLVESIRSAIKVSGVYEQINRGVVVIGGGALLPGLMERIGQETNFTVKLGKINFVAQGFLSNAALYTSVAGLVQAGFGKSRKAISTFKENLAWPQLFGQKVKELYQEYF